MKSKNICAALLMLAGGLTFTGCHQESAQATDASIILENILTRTSIRSFRAQPVEDDKVELMLKAAMAAPSAGNKQPWEFVVINDRATLDALGEKLPRAKMLATAPLAIILCGDTTNVFPGEGKDYWVQDVSAATENLLLAAHALGLGAVWTGVYPISERVNEVKQFLNMPAKFVPLCVVPIGYPAENPSPKDKWSPAKIHYGKW